MAACLPSSHGTLSRAQTKHLRGSKQSALLPGTVAQRQRSTLAVCLQQSVKLVPSGPSQRCSSANPRNKQLVIYSYSTRTAAAASVAPAPSEEEIQTLVAQVKDILATQHSHLPCGPKGRDDEELLRWFLWDRKYRVEPAVEKLAAAINWRYSFGVAQLTAADVAEEAATRKAYLHEHFDADGRPVIVVEAARHFPDPSRLVRSQQLCAFLIERAIEQLPPGEEQFHGIFNLHGFTPKNTDFKFVGFLIDVFFKYYPKRLGRVLFVDAPFIFQPGWKVMKPMLKSYANLVVFCSADEVREKYFLPGQAPASFQK